MLGAVPPPAAHPLERVARVPRPVCPGCARCGRGDPAPAPQRAPLRAGVARCGGGGRASPGGGCLPPLCEGRLRSGAVPPPTARLLGGLLGSATHVLWARVCGCGGPTLSLWPACPVGAACGGGGGGLSPGGWPATVARGPPRVRRCPSPGRPSSGAGGRGSATRVSRVQSVRAWGPSTGPTACALASRRCSLWGWPKGVPGGGAFHHCEGRLRSGAVPLPTARPLGGPLGSATHVLWAWVCGCGGPTLSPWPACPLGAMCRGDGGGRSPGGWPATVVRGAWSQALSLPRPPVLWSGQPGFRDPCVPDAVGAGVGTQHRSHSVRPCGPALLAVGVAEGRPQGG